MTSAVDSVYYVHDLQYFACFLRLL